MLFGQGCLERFPKLTETYPNPPCSKPWAIAHFWSKSPYPNFMFKTMGYSPGFLVKIGPNFGPFGIHPKSSQKFWKVVGKSPFVGCFSGIFGRFPKLTQIRHVQNHGNPFASTLDAFQDFWNDSRNLPKSAMFKTMGYSPGFLVKIGQFRTLLGEVVGNPFASPLAFWSNASSEIFTKSFWKVIGKAFWSKSAHRRRI